MTDPAALLVVDDDPDVLMAAEMLLRQHFATVITSSDPEQIPTLKQQQHIDVFLLDMNFAIGRNTGDEGLTWLRRLLRDDPDAVVVLMTAFGDLNTAVRAMREGAADFVLKPWQNEKLVASLNVAAELARSRATVEELKLARDALAEPSGEFELIAESPVMQPVMRLVERAAPTDANVLILGENGTGKELIARAVQRQSQRASEVMVSVDLGAVPESLFESELFGHTRGAFTDAHSARAGRFQAAQRGTLFLDEIGNLPPASQTKLLRVLEQREVTPIGSDASVPVDVRLIAASNRPLDAMVTDGSFRADLLYRLNTIQIELPPLRDRSDDIPALTHHFIALHARKYRLPERALSPAALDALCTYPWPGNVRELSHAVERALILAEGDTLDVGDFMLRSESTGQPNDGSLNLEATERRLIAIALERHAGNISHAADALGITRAALYRRLQKFDL